MRATGEVEGTTEDVSRSGLAVMFEDSEVRGALGVGDIAHITLHLPQSPQFSPKYLACDAKVVRVETAPRGQQTIAFSVRRMRFCDRAGLENPVQEAAGELEPVGYVQ
jgi:PilZ domain-containing protein